jgi:hypothetical protein
LTLINKLLEKSFKLQNHILIGKNIMKMKFILNYQEKLIIRVFKIILILGVVFVVYNLLMGIWSLSWVKTDGYIVHNRFFKKKIAVKGGRLNGFMRSEKEIDVYIFEYTYAVDYKGYRSSRISYFDSSCEDTTGDFNKKYITVYYNKYFPYFSVIKKGVCW